MGRIFLVLMVPMLSLGFTDADRASIQETIQKFHNNPSSVLNETKTDLSDSEKRARLEFKDRSRREIMGEADLDGRAGRDSENEMLMRFFEGRTPITNIFEMDAQSLLKAQVKQQPWSDHYWPIYAGGLGVRYADPNARYTKDWLENKTKIDADPASEKIKSGDPLIISRISPSEKYDLLVNDNEYSLTRAQWEQGKAYYDQYGKVESWMGICHGWAPAAFMMDRPENVIDVLAADGETVIRFFPTDIKALASLLWANTRTRTHFVGGRCNDKEPPKDENGRITSQKCFDTNPGTWHILAVNRIHTDQKSFVIDATFDYEVWNQPMLGYNYSYFNPKTGAVTDDINEAKTLVSEFAEDKFTKYRDPSAQAVVGVAMDVQYMFEIHPIPHLRDDETLDKITRSRYLYDLELDPEGNILGGEWYRNAHPDFLWAPEDEARALSYYDLHILDETWAEGDPLPSNWGQVAPQGARSSTPLAKIVESLIEFSTADPR